MAHSLLVMPDDTAQPILTQQFVAQKSRSE